jgi:CRISPR/Cas system CSM-associated protein Csm3 (group 7 of RAMP superfamily)
MKDITYYITFFSEWHCGSGLSSGSDLDALVIKDKDRFPFIPGKTLKGLIREATEEIYGSDSLVLKELFGHFDEKSLDNSDSHSKGTAFFSDATISAKLKAKVNKELTDFFYRDLTSTAIGKNSIAEAHSLRKMETTIPCELCAMIAGVDEKYIGELTKCMQWIKRLGQNRHRGLGRCKFEIMEQKEANQ